MGKNFLVSVDLEGIHDIVGVPYESLHTGKPDYDKAVENAIKEVNAVVKGLFDGGASLVAVWDCHWLGKNIDFSYLDSRVIRVENLPQERYERLSFAKDYAFDGILYIGYHSYEGGFNGVLAHTYSAIGIQYYKINGEYVGEFDIDSYVAGDKGIPALFCSSDDVCISQAIKLQPKLKTVITKYGKGRNSAEFRDEKEVLNEMYLKAKECVNADIEPIKLKYPANIEVRFTRAESAQIKLEKIKGYNVKVAFGDDAHVIKGQIDSCEELETFI